MDGRADLEAALTMLPRDHLSMLRGALSGRTLDELAAEAGVPAEAVVPMLRVGIAKLDRSLAEIGRSVGPTRQ